MMMMLMMMLIMIMMMFPAGPAVCAAWRCLTRSRSPPSYELDIVIPCDRSTVLQYTNIFDSIQIFSTCWKYSYNTTIKHRWLIHLLVLRQTFDKLFWHCDKTATSSSKFIFVNSRKVLFTLSLYGYVYYLFLSYLYLAICHTLVYLLHVLLPQNFRCTNLSSDSFLKECSFLTLTQYIYAPAYKWSSRASSTFYHFTSAPSYICSTPT